MAGVNFNDTDSKAGSGSSASPLTYTPVVTLVGGSGNVVPQYVDNIGRYFVQGKLVHVDIYLNGDGGNEGAGTGFLNISLPPFLTSANTPYSFIPGGYFHNGGHTNAYALMVEMNPSVSTIQVAYIFGGATRAYMDGNSQGDVNRTIRLQFWYEID